MSRPLILLFCVICVISFGSSAKILGIFSLPGYSHFVLGLRTLEELANRGHEVTMVSSYQVKNKVKNYSEVHLDGLMEIINAEKKNFYSMEEMFAIEQIMLVYNLGYTITNYTLAHPNFKKLLASDKQFDVVIIDQFVSEGLVSIAKYYNAPLVYVCSWGTNIWSNGFVRNPAPYSYVPNKFLEYVGTLNFSQRLNNLVLHVMEEIYRKIVVFPSHNNLIQEHFPGYPHISELNRRDPLFLLNTHSSIIESIPLVPNMIEVAGFHIKQSKLPDDIKNFLDQSTNGVVFFAMGSNLKTSDLSEQKKSALLGAFRSLKLNVLWKWEEEELPGLPKNVKIAKWLPQQDILAHPNVKVFISHGGLLSTIEAVYFGVPMIGIPVYADQKSNINLAEKRGYAIQVPFKNVTEANIKSALDEILNNNKYRENILKRSKLMNDRDLKPMDKAIYWIEHVIRHKGLAHFRNNSMELSWYEYEMLDVAAFLVLLALIFVKLTIVLTKLICGAAKTKQTKLKTS